MESKFTKGPWKVYEYGRSHWNNPNLPHVTIHYGNNEEHIVDTVYELADAHLIAAAPEMYDFINRFTIATHEECDKMLEEAYDLLSKARGEL